MQKSRGFTQNHGFFPYVSIIVFLYHFLKQTVDIVYTFIYNARLRGCLYVPKY